RFGTGLTARRRCAYAVVLPQETTRRRDRAKKSRRTKLYCMAPHPRFAHPLPAGEGRCSRSEGFAMFAALLFAIAVDARIDQLLSKMTLEEKLVQLTEVTEEQLPSIPAGVLLSSGGAAHINEIQRNRKIPLLVGYDVIHGYRTIFPIPLAIASSWDPRMAELSAGVAAKEARAAGIHWTFAPMVDIARDARWGRIAEGAGEDPVLGSAMAAGYVRGFQSNGVLACAKHFAVYGAAEAGRDYNAVEMSERTLREIYLPPFRSAVDAGVATLMSAFESVNGVPASANHHLLTDILRKEWK